MPNAKTTYHIGKTVRTLLIPDNPLFPAVLREVVSIADRKNIVHLNTYRKQLILTKLRIKNEHSTYIRVSLIFYVKKNYLVKIAEDTYMINPHIAFNCSNEEFIYLVNDYDKYRQIAYSNKNRQRKKEKLNPITQAKEILRNELKS